MQWVSKKETQSVIKAPLLDAEQLAAQKLKLKPLPRKEEIEAENAKKFPGRQGEFVSVHRAPHLLCCRALDVKKSSARPTPCICLPREMRSLFHWGGTL